LSTELPVKATEPPGKPGQSATSGILDLPYPVALVEVTDSGAQHPMQQTVFSFG